MKSRGLQKETSNSEKFGSKTLAYIQKAQFSIFFMNLEKLRDPARVTFVNSLTYIKIKLLLKYFVRIFCKYFVNISYENASFRTLEDSIWLPLISFLTA